MSLDYPITITANDIEQRGPCKAGLTEFREHYPDGLVVHDALHQSALLAGPLGKHESWAIAVGLLPPIRTAAGDGSTLTAGDGSTLTGGYRSTLTGGDDSTLTWRYWDGHRHRLHTVYTGEDGIEPGVGYVGRVVEGKFTVSRKETTP